MGNESPRSAPAGLMFGDLAAAEPGLIPDDLVRAADVLLAWLWESGAQVDIDYDVRGHQADLVAAWPSGRAIALAVLVDPGT